MADEIGQMFSLDGRVAVVTGASRGLGAAVADGLAAAGAKVVGVARSVPADGVETLVEYESCDVTDTARFKELCGLVMRKWGRIDILVNAAGVTLPAEGLRQDLSVFRKTIETNLSSLYACCTAVAENMDGHRGGSIINFTSIGAVRGFPDNPAYVAAKGGVQALTRALAVDLGAVGIRVNNLAPGYMRTDMTSASYADPDENERRRCHTILGRWGEPQDIVGAAIFLASDASSYVTGTDLFIDGGWTAKGLV